MRKYLLSSAILATSLAFASCSSAQSGDSTESSSSTPMPVIAGEPVDMPDGSPFSVASHGTFDEPWAIAFEPGTGRIFITEKPGTAKIYDPATGAVMDVTGLPEVVYERQGGLGEIAFAPDYADSRMIYLSWAAADEGDTAAAAVGRGTLTCGEDSCAVEGLTEIWRQSRGGERRGHYSHRIAFSPDGQYLFVSSGDRQEQDPAQDLSNTLGAVVRLNLDGTPAAGNPFADQGSPTDQIWSYGQRNLLGFAYDLDGNLWDLEHGPAGGDELNLVEPGNNYGWPTRSYGENYNGDPIPDHTADDGFAKPAIYWTPVIGPGGMEFYGGAMFADWQGDLLVAALTVQSIVHIRADAATNSAEEVARYEFGTRLRDITVAPDGAIWVAENGPDGRLLRLTPAE